MSSTSSKGVFRAALVAAHEGLIDPELQLDPQERRRRADDAIRQHMSDLGKRSAETRRRRAALAKAAERQIANLTSSKGTVA